MYVRSCRCDQQQVRAVRQLNVARSPAFLFVEEARHHRIFRKRLQRERRNKFGRVVCHDHEDFVTLFDQQTRKLGRFVRGDRSRHAEHDRFPAAGMFTTFRGLLFSNLRLELFSIAAISINLASAAGSRMFQQT